MSSPSAAQLCGHFELSAEGRALLAPEAKPRAFLDLLLQNNRHEDAAQLMSHALPKREAVWWACQCLRKSAELSKSALEIVAAAESWSVDPTDEQRRKTFELAELASFEPPTCFLGMAVFFSGGSLSLPNLPPVEPKEHLTGTMIGNAVKLAALAGDAAKAPERYAGFLSLGLDIVNGKARVAK